MRTSLAWAGVCGALLLVSCSKDDGRAARVAGGDVAFISCGGNSAKAPANQAIASYVDWARETGPRLQRHGITRVHLQNPGGIWPQPPEVRDRRKMRVEQWLMAEEAGLSFADRGDFAQAVQILNDHGVDEVIVYLGSPTQLAAEDVERELPRCVEPFLQAGPTVSIAFDAAFMDKDRWQSQWAPDAPHTKALIALRPRVHKLYVEPALPDEQIAAGLGELVDGTISQMLYFKKRGEKLDLTSQPGETIAITDVNQEPGIAWPTEVTRCLRFSHNWGPLADKADGER